MFEHWCKSYDVKDLDDLKNLILLEQFKRCVHERVATYLNKYRGLTLEKAAVLADEFTLTHKSTFPSKSQNTFMKTSITSKTGLSPTQTDLASRVVCQYCHIKGYIVHECPVLKKKEKLKTIALLVSPLTVKPLVQDFPSVKGKVPDEFQPFTSEGFVSLPGCPASKQPSTFPGYGT